MKRFAIALMLVSLLLPVIATAEVSKVEWGSSYWFLVTPGLYEVGEGKDIEPGTYDVRFGGGDEKLTLTFSELLTDDGSPDLNFFYSYRISVFSNQWGGGSHPVILMPSFGYLLIEGQSCRLYPVEFGY